MDSEISNWGKKIEKEWGTEKKQMKREEIFK